MKGMYPCILRRDPKIEDQVCSIPLSFHPVIGSPQNSRGPLNDSNFGGFGVCLRWRWIMDPGTCMYLGLFRSKSTPGNFPPEDNPGCGWIDTCTGEMKGQYPVCRQTKLYPHELLVTPKPITYVIVMGIYTLILSSSRANPPTVHVTNPWRSTTTIAGSTLPSQ